MLLRSAEATTNTGRQHSAELSQLKESLYFTETTPSNAIELSELVFYFQIVLTRIPLCNRP